MQSRQCYPEAARRQGAEGQVALRVAINHDGQVLDVQVARGSGTDLLDKRCLPCCAADIRRRFPPT